MDAPPRRFPSRLAANLGLLVLAAGAVLGACLASPTGRPDVPPQRWWEDRGPVVPHDSFPADCSLCHTSDNWSEVRADFHFDHEKETGVALEGAHATAECLRCHNDRGPVELFAQRGCRGCHEDVHQGELGTQCSDCHTQQDWQPFGQVADHNRTRFPLVGAHVSVACYACHEGAQVGVFTPNDINCVSCHQTDLAQATEPDHVAQGWVESCDRCHIPTTWKGAGFTHAAFPLSGAHADAQCLDCHASGFTGTPSNCAACHSDEYDATTNPNHASAGYSQQCQSCHDTNSWEGAVFDHSSFPLTGGHAGATCAQCHPGGKYQGTSSSCVSCHLTDYQGTDNPDHAAAGYSQQCQQCHSTSSWEGAVVDHSFFPLTGAHSAADCLQCHAGGVYQGTPTTCIGCHQDDYDGTNDPNHAAAGFSTDCLQCHSTSAWNGASFSHSFYPLTGQHATADCLACHAGGVFQGTPTNCVACHQDDYDGTNNPDHAAAGFPTDCQACHDTGGWNGATFNHSFPITSGAHKNLSCNDCHLAGGNYSSFSCIDCHAHTKSKMDNDHQGKQGYSWNSQACLNCHPNGKS